MADSLSTTDREQIVKQVRAEYDAGLLYRHDREREWKLIEDFYFNRVLRNIKGRFNVPVPIIPGFVDTWQAKVSRHVELNFDQGADSADYRAAKKATAFYQKIRGNDDYDWDMLETDGTKLAGIYAIAPYRYYAESMDGYKSHLDLVDPYDLISDPLSGRSSERGKFHQVDNIFKNREELKAGAGQGYYEADSVTRLLNVTRNDKLVDNDNVFHSKLNRLIALRLNGISYNYAGQELYKLKEAYTIWKGKRYHVIYNYEAAIGLRIVPLVEDFESDLWPVCWWHPNPDSYNHLPKGPCDDMLPLAEVIRVLVNQQLDNRQKQNYEMRGYDPAIIKDPSQLEWRPDGLVAFNAGSAQMLGDLGRGVVHFKTESLQGTIEMANWIDAMLKEKTGVNSEAQGASDQSKVGIAYLNVQQSTERMRLALESKTKCWKGIGRRFLWGLKEHMRGAESVRIIGEKGYEEDKLRRFEINPKWDVQISGIEDNSQKDAIQKKQLVEMFNTFAPDELAATNPKWRVKVKLQALEIPDDEQRLAFDLSDDGNRDILSQASKMIQDCLEGKEYKPFRGANTAFIQKIIDFATDNDLPLEKYEKLMAIAEEHIPIAEENAARKAVQVRSRMGLSPAGAPAAPGAPGIAPAPPAGTAAGTQSMSQEVAELPTAPPQMA